MSCTQRDSRRGSECGGPGEGCEAEEGGGRHGQLLTRFELCMLSVRLGQCLGHSPPIRETRKLCACITTLAYTAVGYFYNIIHTQYPLYAFCENYFRLVCARRPRGVVRTNARQRSIVCGSSLEGGLYNIRSTHHTLHRHGARNDFVDDRSFSCGILRGRLHRCFAVQLVVLQLTSGLDKLK